jgi:dethiobiotin synthetase
VAAQTSSTIYATFEHLGCLNHTVLSLILFFAEYISTAQFFVIISYQPAAHAIEKNDVNIAGIVSNSQTFLKQSKCSAKRNKKNDDDKRASSSIKTQEKERAEKYSPTATVVAIFS